MVKCSTCNKKISERAKVCPHCGEKTEYGSKLQSQLIKRIVFIIIFGILVYIFISKCLLPYTNINGMWKFTEDYEKGTGAQYHSRFDDPGVIKGKKSTIYTFKSNGKCVEKVVINGTKYVDEYCNNAGRCFNAYAKPYENEETRKCEYKVKNKKIELFFYEEYNETKEYCDNIDSDDPDDQCVEWTKKDFTENHYYRTKNDNIFIDGNKYIRMK